MNDDTNITIQVLSSSNLPADKLKKFLSGDKRAYVNDIQKFIRLNDKAFEYLGVTAQGVGDSFNYSLVLNSSKYSGVVPLRSAKTGLVCGYLKIVGRYGEDVDDILPLLKDEDFSPEFNDSMTIGADMAVAPPKYIECAKYVDKYEQAYRFHWQKFSNKCIIQKRPRNTDWTRYSKEFYNPYSALKYPNRINELTTEHPEWTALQYVLMLAIKELGSTKTPISLRGHYASIISQLERTFDKNALRVVEHIKIHSSDPVIIKELKELANLILNDSSDARYAWRIDYSKFFEKYIQYLFKLLAYKKGARVINNPHYNISGYKPAWAMKYLEPDLVMIKDSEQITIDAKYKSHMYNWDSNSKELHDTFREDFHQILAYSSFGKEQQKKTIIAYPFKEFKYYSTTIRSSLNECENQTLLIGIPISKASIDDVITSINELI